MKTNLVKIIFILFIISFSNACKQNCKLCDATQINCYICERPQHQIIQNGYCKNIDNLVQGCRIYSAENKCISCFKDHELYQEKCIKKIRGCIQYSDQSICQKCVVGMKLTQSSCSGVQFCKNYNQYNECLYCEEGFKLLANKCQKQNMMLLQSRRLLNQIPHCIKVVGNSCIQCQSNYKIISNGACGLKSTDPNCIVSDINGVCQKCSVNFWIKNGLCTQINIICKTADQKTGDCLSCFSGFILSGKNCITLVQDPHCSFINPVTAHCQKCSVGYHMHEGKCVQSSLQCTKTDSQGKCLVCYKGYSLNDGVCVAVINPDGNCISYENNICIACKQRYFINNNISCAPVSPSCLTYNPLNGYCLTCPTDKTLVKNYCAVAHCKVSILGVCQQCEQKYHFTGGKCAAIPIQNCDVFEANKCIKCAKSYYLKNNTCVSASPICKVLDSFSGKCIQCFPNYVLSPEFYCIDVNCQIANLQKCNKCNPKFYLSNNSCHQILLANCDEFDPIKQICMTCGDRYFVKNGTCAKVNPVCNLYSQDTGYCINCFSGYTVYENYCKDVNCNVSHEGICNTCNPRFYLQNAICTSIPIKNCDIYNGKICTKCSDRYYWNVSICQQINPTCNSYNSKGVCLTCIAGFKLADDNHCQDEHCSVSENGVCSTCQPKYFLSNTKCVAIPISNCQQYKNGTCKKCLPRFYLTQHNFCNPVNPSCDTYDNEGKCLTCATKGYILSTDSYCMDPNCKTSYVAICRECQLGYFLQTNNTCGIIPIPDCLIFANNTCLSCAQGFNLLSGSCRKSKQSIHLGCLQFAHGRCTKCQMGYNLQHSNCVKKSLCIKFDSKGNCISCPPNYTVNINECVLMNSQNLKNCRFHKNNICLQCSINYWKIGNQCIPAGKNCYSYNNTSGKCTKCPLGYNLDSNFDCVTNQQLSCLKKDSNKVCIKCVQTFILNPEKKCIPFSPLCATVNSTTGKCSTCFEGYSLVNQSCINSNPDPNCKIKSPNGVCQQCSQNFFFKNGRCNQVSPLCATADPTTGDCLSCYSGFALDNKICIKSQDPNCKIIHNDACRVCSKGFVVKFGKCVKVSQLCHTYNENTGSCLTCYSGYILKNNTCIIEILDPNCKKYQNGVCQGCVSGFYLKNNQCNQVSPLCHTYDNITGVCTSCFSGFIMIKNGTCEMAKVDPNCRTTKDGVCVQCATGYSFVKGVCTIENLLCKTLDVAKNKCTSCYSGYSLNNGNCQISANNDPNCQQRKGQFCIICNDRYWLSNNICTAVSIQCQGYNPSNGYCTSCFPNYIIQFGNCVPIQKNQDPYCNKTDINATCISCVSGYYLNQGTCTMVSALCKTFDYSNNQCVECQKGYFLQQSQCIYPALGLDSNCIYYDGGYCSKCKENYYVVNFLCTIVDKCCTQFNYDLSICQKCIQGKQPNGAICN